MTVASWPVLWSWAYRGRSDSVRIFPGPSPQRGNGGCEGCEGCEEQLHGCSERPRARKWVTQWVSPAALLSFLVLFHLTAPLSVTLSPWTTCVVSRWPRQIWLRRAPGCRAPKVPHSWLPHALLSPTQALLAFPFPKWGNWISENLDPWPRAHS